MKKKTSKSKQIQKEGTKELWNNRTVELYILVLQTVESFNQCSMKFFEQWLKSRLELSLR